jgi:hypothetical protein
MIISQEDGDEKIRNNTDDNRKSIRRNIPLHPRNPSTNIGTLQNTTQREETVRVRSGKRE